MHEVANSLINQPLALHVLVAHQNHLLRESKGVPAVTGPTGLQLALPAAALRRLNLLLAQAKVSYRYVIAYLVFSELIFADMSNF